MKQKSISYPLRSVAKARRRMSELSSIEFALEKLQQNILSPGMHCITIPTHDQGREVLSLCLDSVGIYQDISMVSMTTKKVPYSYRDLYAEMSSFQALSADTGRLEEFLLSCFQSDFLIIEYTQELLEQAWFGKFEQLLYEYKVPQAIPIVMLLYSETELIKN